MTPSLFCCLWMHRSVSGATRRAWPFTHPAAAPGASARGREGVLAAPLLRSWCGACERQGPGAPSGRGGWLRRREAAAAREGPAEPDPTMSKKRVSPSLSFPSTAVIHTGLFATGQEHCFPRGLHHHPAHLVREIRINRINQFSSFCELDTLTSALHWYARHACSARRTACLSPPALVSCLPRHPSPSPSIYKPTNRDPTRQPFPLRDSHTQGRHPPALITPGPHTRQLETALMPQATEIIQTSQS